MRAKTTVGIFVCALVSHPSVSTATAIGALRTEQEIAIAADSRVSQADGNWKTIQACKVRVASETVYAAYGMTASYPTRFDIMAVVSFALFDGGDLRALSERVADVGASKLSHALTVFRQRFPGDFGKRRGAGVTTGVLLGRVEEGVPRLDCQNESVSWVTIVPQGGRR